MTYSRRSTDGMPAPAPTQDPDDIEPRGIDRNPHFPGGVPYQAWRRGYEGLPALCPKGSLYESWYLQGAAAAAYDAPSWFTRLATWIWNKLINPPQEK